MKIPIFNYVCRDLEHKLNTNKINFNILNNLELKKPINKQFPLLKILNRIPENISLFETILISANDELVENFLNGNIKFNQIHKILFKIVNLKEFKKFKYKKPKNFEKIIKLNKYVRLKTLNQCIV